MFWEDILRTLGGMAILVAALAWLAKKLLTALLSKDLERFKSELQYSSQINLESFKASLQREAQRQAVEHAALHAKRAELIAELYSRIVCLYDEFLGLSRELGAREVRAEEYKTSKSSKAQPWELKTGIHTLSSSEEATAKALQKEYKDFSRFYREKKIYFSEDVCTLIDSFTSLTGYMGIMYENVAIRDDDDQSYVNPMVFAVWEKVGNQIPTLLAALEKEFRVLLGVIHVQA